MEDKIMAYATVEDVQSRMSKAMTGEEQNICSNLLDDAAVIIDSYNAEASGAAKKLVSCRIVGRAMSACDMDIPLGATQGSKVGLGYTESWTINSGGSIGELYLGKTEKKLLGYSGNIISRSPLEFMTEDVI
jgi:hypothetical protein